MRIVIATGLYPPESGGPATYTALLERELPRSGIEVVVLPFRIVRRLPPGIRHFVYFWKCWRLARKADVVYAQDPVSVGLPALCAARLAGRRFLLKVVGDWAWEQGVQRFGITEMLDDFVVHDEYPLLLRMFCVTERYVAQHAEAVVVPSEYLKKIVAAWGVPKKRIKVIHNSLEPVALSGNRPVLRELIKAQGPLIISFGRLVPWKGFAALIDALGIVREKIPQAKLFIVGNGPELQSLEAHAAAQGLGEAVVFGGAVEREALMRYLEAADAFALNTRYEGFSHALLEAMAVGVPVVTTPVGGNVEIVEDGINGLLVKPDDTRALAAALIRVLADSALNRRLAAGGRQTLTRFTKERMLSELILILKKKQ